MENEGQIALRSLWDNIDGDICIIYPALNRMRWAKELKMLFHDHLKNNELLSPKLRTDEGTEELAKWLSRFGPHITSGDIYACMHVIMLLSVFYGADIIKLQEAFNLFRIEKQGPVQFKNKMNNNLVLIGGPSGNPITNKVLNDANLNNIFPDAPNVDFNVIMPDGKSFHPNPIPNNSKTEKDIEDIGVFLKMKNPYNPSKVIFAAMGSNSWGTQGAASLACSPEGAKIIHNIHSNGILLKYDLPKSIHSLACIKVFKNQGTFIDELDDNREIKFQLLWPTVEQEMLSNPKSVSQAISFQINELRNAAASQMHIALSFGWGRAVLTVLFFMIAAVFLCLTLQKIIPLTYAIPLNLVTLYSGIYCFSGLPHARKY